MTVIIFWHTNNLTQQKPPSESCTHTCMNHHHNMSVLSSSLSLFILPHHKYNENNKKIERVDLTMARRPKGNYEA